MAQEPSPAKDTKNQEFTVYYPFHPYCGQSFRPDKYSKGPPPSYRVTLRQKRFTIPAWMTRPSAAAHLLTHPISLEQNSLLEIAAIVKNALGDFSLSPAILSLDAESKKGTDNEATTRPLSQKREGSSKSSPTKSGSNRRANRRAPPPSSRKSVQ